MRIFLALTALLTACRSSRPPELPSSGSVTMGTAAPLLVQRVDPQGRWVVACQAREDTDHNGRLEVSAGPHGEVHGDAMTPYLLLPGRDEPLDDFVAADPRGDRIAFLQKGRLLVRDFSRAKELDLTALGADPQDSPSPFGSHRAASFDRDGKLLYLRKTPSGTKIVVRSFSSPLRVETMPDGTQLEQNELEFDPGPGLLLRADLDEDGAWAIAQIVTKDQNGNGRLDPPTYPTSLAPRRCRAMATYTAGTMVGDAPEKRLFYLFSNGPKTPLSFPDLLRPLGTSVLRRPKTGELLLTTSDGKTTELVPASCGAKLLYADPARQLVVVACAAGGARAPVEVHGIKVHKKLPVTVDATKTPDRDGPSRSSRLAFVPLEHGTATLDLDTLALTMPKGDDERLADHEGRALVRRKGRLLRYNADARSEIDLGVTVAADAAVHATGAMVAVDPFVVDLDHGRVAGRFSGRPIAINEQGAVLFMHSLGSRGVGTGPLYWARPRPATATP